MNIKRWDDHFDCEHHSYHGYLQLTLHLIYFEKALQFLDQIRGFDQRIKKNSFKLLTVFVFKYFKYMYTSVVVH